MARFPLTAAALEQEAATLVEALLQSPSFSNAIQGLVMASVKELKDALDIAKASVDTLVGKVGQASASGIDPAELDPVLAELNTLRSTVETLSASIKPPAPPAPPAPAA